MATLSNASIEELLQPYLQTPAPELLDRLSLYLDLLLKWNARTNLTAVRRPDEIVQVHFGQSLYATPHLPPASTLLDLGSGAGFPGIPLQLAIPNLKVTLAESQSKKASFLREVVRSLGLTTEVWGSRIEMLNPSRRFEIVTLRAVDDPTLALELANKRLAPAGTIAHWTTAAQGQEQAIPIPNSDRKVIHLIQG
jgi:16S rRNA (guanine527-N7)-methyltransferase